jgi:hypothetical protein
LSYRFIVNLLWNIFINIYLNRRSFWLNNISTIFLLFLFNQLFFEFVAKHFHSLLRSFTWSITSLTFLLLLRLKFILIWWHPYLATKIFCIFYLFIFISFVHFLNLFQFMLLLLFNNCRIIIIFIASCWIFWLYNW